MKTQTLIDFILPSTISNKQSALSAKNLLWVANIINLSDLFCLFKSSKISLAVSISKLPVGSSARIISGLFTIALAIAILWASPPDNWEGKWSDLFERPISLSNFSAFFIANSLLSLTASEAK